MGRVQRGWNLTKISWHGIQEQPVALVLPLVAAFAEGLAWSAFSGDDMQLAFRRRSCKHALTGR